MAWKKERKAVTQLLLAASPGTQEIPVLEPEHLSRYLKSSAIIDGLHPLVQGKAREPAEGFTNAVDIVRSCFLFVLDRIFLEDRALIGYAAIAMKPSAPPCPGEILRRGTLAKTDYFNDFQGSGMNPPGSSLFLQSGLPDESRDPHGIRCAPVQDGFCYDKKYLLAALLRANGIPAGLCYQRPASGEP